ncbi:cytochrome c oxidase subunit 5B, mitochondrial-like [Chrysoperla carnea]|uniref:cytochrome c oxidase subunit 5B, mitochondrial-like n=1 Tax=Chrysoperla carnea TaxID=189513 RepID=UPI001D0958E6|nr:cytochrome c oxidase subunit 5B, mitochondrial-like [Chrysoperla carnea]
MASLCSRILFRAPRRHLALTASRFADKPLADPVEHATGIEKREILAKISGNDDPFDMKVIKRVDGGKSNPTLIPSAFDARIVGCVCEEDATSVTWMWLHKGQPKRCECGYWYKLVEKTPI